MPGGGQGGSGLGGSGVSGSTQSPFGSALQGATSGLGWVGSHIPFIHHGGGSPQAPVAGAGQGTSGTPQYDSYGRITGYTPTTTNSVPNQPNLPSYNASPLWNLLSQMGVFNGQVQAPSSGSTNSDGAPQGTMGGSVQSNQQSAAFLNAIMQILGIPMPSTNVGSPSVPAFGASQFSGLNHDGSGSYTYSNSVGENNQFGYWGKDAYAGNGSGIGTAGGGGDIDPNGAESKRRAQQNLLMG